MKRYSLVILFAWLSTECFSQGFPAVTPGASVANPPLPFVFDGNGRPLYWGTPFVADGSPFFYDDYIAADITLASGKMYKGIKVKFNIVERQLQYLNKDSVEMIADLAVASIKFTLSPENKESTGLVKLMSNTGILNSPDAVIYEVLDSGKVSVLRKITVTYRDETTYGSTNTTRHFVRKESDYFFLIGKEYKKILKTKEFFTETLKDKKKEIESFINLKSLKCKSVQDYLAITRLYNSL
jgi:hypothetical protein